VEVVALTFKPKPTSPQATSPRATSPPPRVLATSGQTVPTSPPPVRALATSSSAAPVSPRGSIAPTVVGEKITQIRSWAVSEIEQDVKPKIVTIRELVDKSTAISQAKPVGQILLNAKHVVDNANNFNWFIRVTQILGKTPPAEVNSKATSSSEDDKLKFLKGVVVTAVASLLNVLDAIKNVLETSSIPEEIVQLVKVVSC
jgi:hypothetical protein